MLTELQWDFQSSSPKKTSVTWKISFTWCFQTPCPKNSKSQTKLSEHWKLSGFVTLTISKMHPLQLSELQEVLLQILLHALRQVLDLFGDLIMVEPMKLFSRCYKKSLKKTWALKVFLPRLKIKIRLSGWWASATEFIRTLTQEPKSCKKCVTTFST